MLLDGESEEKMTMKAMKMEDEDEYEKMEKEQKRHQERVSKVILEESVIMLKDEMKVMDVVFEELKKVNSAVTQEEEQVLRTRIVSPRELLQEAPKWDEAIKKELHQLFEEKEALKKINEKEFQQLQQTWGKRLEVVPSKVVIALKPGPRRKIRLVACRNFVDRTSEEEKDRCLYASGADAVCLRYVLKRAAEEDWKASVMDIRAAFLNAPLDNEQDVPTMVVLKPPALLIKTGHVQHNEYYLAQKAMYGLRQSPRCWGLRRDGVLRKMRSEEKHYFVQSAAEPNLWAILKGDPMEEGSQDEQLEGFLLVYVDDLMIVGEASTIQVITKTLQQEWETSAPEELGSEGKVKFLGMELTKGSKGEFIASQEDYIKDKEGVEGGKRIKVPMNKDAHPTPEDPTPELVNKAQKLVGELMWLSTRTRPDISYATSRCAQEILAHPAWVIEQATQVWRYLKNTPNEGLKFGKEKGEGWDGGPRALEVFTDSSFVANPETQASHGSVMVTWNGSMMFWKSGKQAFPALSTAESELLEAIEGLQTGDAVDFLINEREDLYKKTLFVDNLAAAGFFADGNANWRTRHLRLRAQHVRWRITNLDWRVRHLPGSVMIADLSTKALTFSEQRS